MRCGAMKSHLFTPIAFTVMVKRATYSEAAPFTSCSGR